MPRSGSFHDLLKQLDTLPTAVADSRSPSLHSPAPLPCEFGELQWIMTGILRLAFLPDDS